MKLGGGRGSISPRMLRTSYVMRIAAALEVVGELATDMSEDSHQGKEAGLHNQWLDS